MCAETATASIDNNISIQLHNVAQRLPYKRAIVEAQNIDRNGIWSYKQLNFEQLEKEIDLIARGLDDIGIGVGSKTVLMVPPSLDFFALTFALFKVGAIPVMIDPGMQKRSMIDCIANVEADAFISIPLGHLIFKMYRKHFPTIEHFVNVGSQLPFFFSKKIHNIHDLKLGKWAPYPICPVKEDDIAAITFTSGSTGPPKGAVYTHKIFHSEIQSFNRIFGYDKDEIDVPTFPLFALFDVALGMTAVIPKMNFSKPATVYPPNVLKLIEDHGATHMFGSPALLDRVSTWCLQRDIHIKTIRRIVTAGAPVRPDILANLKKILPDDSEIYTAYGATEALPIAVAKASDILKETAEKYYNGWGTYVGTPDQSVSIKIIKTTDDEIKTTQDVRFCDNNEIGEIIVKGPAVTQSYYRNVLATTASKIHDSKNVYWHRMGDCGYLDEQNRLWFCGRKTHRIITENGTLFTEPVEGIFNAHKQVFRSALVGIGPRGRETPVLWVEPRGKYSKAEKADLKVKLLKLAKSNPLTSEIHEVLFHKSFPVDVRHNAKIFREKLKKQAENLLKADVK